MSKHRRLTVRLAWLVVLSASSACSADAEEGGGATNHDAATGSAGAAGAPPDAASAGSGGTGGDADAGARILSAFFGLDDDLPPLANALCRDAAGRDGMPIVLDRRVALPSAGAQLAASAFAVTRVDGSTARLTCATLAPAVEAHERHTILLVGDLGAHPENPPTRVSIVESLPLEDGGDARGASTNDVVPLPDGPSLVLAERFDPTKLPAGGADDCPPNARGSIVRIAWSGGVSAPGGVAVGDEQRRAVALTFRDERGAEREAAPDALADVGDNDNYLELCSASADRVVRVKVSAGSYVDPNLDANASQDLAVP